MALEAPLRSSTGSLKSPFSPHTDMSISSPDSPAVGRQFLSMSSESSTDSPQGLRPNSFPFRRPNSRPNSDSNHLMSPMSDIVGPSPVTSNGTETTEIEDDESIDTDFTSLHNSPPPQRMSLRTNIPDHLRKTLSEEAVSVIHAPQSFQHWPTNQPTTPADLVSPPPSEHSTKSPTVSPPPISTNIKPAKYNMDTATPQAQNLPDFIGDNTRLRSSSASSLELIPENQQGETDAEEYQAEYNSPDMDGPEYKVNALRTAFEDCWTVCNTLLNLSSIHRKHVFNSSGTPDAHERAWKCCWKLCQRLYQSRDESVESIHGRTNLDLCRDFCQSLFDVRTRRDDTADSVLRVSFELNNHLYSAQDTRNLPEAFRERTLDFYIALCHRLMKQRSDLAEETDSLLRACWSLAEILFSLRQTRRDGREPDEELLGSAFQACWDLCDIFREGGIQVRPERSTPRPSQVTFSWHHTNNAPSVMASDTRSTAGSRASMHSKRESLRSNGASERPRRHNPPPVPETPVTEFEDTPISPESSSPQMPNIMVLGTASEGSSRTSGPRWSSNASNLSGYSQSSAKTSSTATAGASKVGGSANGVEDVNITRIKMLVVKAAMNIGFNRDTAAVDGLGGATSLQKFVKSLPTGTFGSLPQQSTLLQSYKNLVLADSAFQNGGKVGGGNFLPARGKRVGASEMAKGVTWMMQRSGQYGFLRELFNLVFGFPLEDAEKRKSVTITV